LCAFSFPAVFAFDTKYIKTVFIVIKHSDRYQSALDNPKKYIEEIQHAGYATDPNYSEKIRAISKSAMFNEMIVAINIDTNEGEF